MNEVIRKGVQTKVLMLSATPVNNHFYDLKCQLELAYAGDYRHFDTLLDTESSINDIFRDCLLYTSASSWTQLESLLKSFGGETPSGPNLVRS